jgi:hypothetical protein
MDVGDDNYQAVTLKEVLRGVIGAVSHVINRGPRHQQLSGPSVDPQHIDGAHLRHHVGGNQHHDLVTTILSRRSCALTGSAIYCFAKLLCRHDQKDSGCPLQ